MTGKLYAHAIQFHILIFVHLHFPQERFMFAASNSIEMPLYLEDLISFGIDTPIRENDSQPNYLIYQFIFTILTLKIKPNYTFI